MHEFVVHLFHEFAVLLFHEFAGQKDECCVDLLGGLGAGFIEFHAALRGIVLSEISGDTF
jgi:hypothetical protein